jgi:hypothetical protein
MEKQDQEKVIGYLIDNIFMPMVLQEIVSFLVEYKEQVIFTHNYKQITGYDIQMGKMTLDLRKPSATLISNITTALNDKPAQNLPMEEATKRT